MKMKLLDKKKHLDNLNLIIKQKEHTPRSLSLLTANNPVGLGKMSHQTIYSILKGDTDAKYWQLQELARILNVKINKIISDNIVKVEIIQYFDIDKSHFVPREYSDPIEVIYYLNNAYLKPSQRAFYWPTSQYAKIPTFSIIDMQHINWCNEKEYRDRLINVDLILQCKKDNLFYFGQVLKFNKDDTCVFQWWKKRFICTDARKFKENGSHIDYQDMIINEFKLIKDCNYKAIFPQLSQNTMFDEDYKIEQIAI